MSIFASGTKDPHCGFCKLPIRHDFDKTLTRCDHFFHTSCLNYTFKHFSPACIICKRDFHNTKSATKTPFYGLYDSFVAKTIKVLKTASGSSLTEEEYLFNKNLIDWGT
jgi:hypothetical protein